VAVETITVEVQDDHIETLSRTRPVNAVAELIWNALDAEAAEVRVDFIENDLEGLEEIRISDNGHGLSRADARAAFGNLGGSWKEAGARSEERKRILHGKYGKGRFRAFSLGSPVRWHSVYVADGSLRTFTLSGEAGRPGAFGISEETPAKAAQSGMTVEILNPPDNAGLLRGIKAQEEITDLFALYLRQYPDVKLIYDGTPIDPVNAEKHCATCPLDELVTPNGDRVTAELTVIEWNRPGRRGVMLCDANGFMRHQALPRLYFRGFSYTAWLKSNYIEALDRQGLLQTEELSDDVRMLLDAARRALYRHFTMREAERAQDALEEWKDLGIYPYPEMCASADAENERRIFEIYATHVNQIFPDFAGTTLRNKELILRLMREIVHCQPARIARVMDDLLKLPEEKEDEILQLADEKERVSS
jgi:hypothetical protein